MSATPEPSFPVPPATMRAMLLHAPGQALCPVEWPVPRPAPGEVLLQVEACGVCRTDLHLIDGELPDPPLPMIPGHEIVGRVVATGPGVSGIAPGRRMGVPWLGWTCRHCEFCLRHQENLCDAARFTGYQIPGGYAEYTVADARYCFPLPEAADPAALAPLLCAGLIG
jgi:alcohol dehydrogenase, propanol-preferring